MEPLAKCILLPLDGTAESLRPISFIRRLYHPSQVSLVLCYFSPPVPSAFDGGQVASRDLLQQKKKFFESQHHEARRVFDYAERTLLKQGFARGSIQEQIEQRAFRVAEQASIVADIMKVDAIIVHKRVTSRLEGFIKGDLSSALLEYCLSNPIWFTEGDIDPANAAICIVDEDASLRVADHAGYMLAGSGSKLTLLHAAAKLSHPLSCRPSEAREKLKSYATSPAREARLSYLLKASAILADYGFDETQVRITLIPHRGDTAGAIFSWCASNGIGIIGLGHSRPEGIWSFLKTSVTRKILSDFKNMAIWVAQ